MYLSIKYARLLSGIPRILDLFVIIVNGIISISVIRKVLKSMADHMEYIVPPWEIEAYVQSLNISVLDDIGTKKYTFLYVFFYICFSQFSTTYLYILIDIKMQKNIFQLVGLP